MSGRAFTAALALLAAACGGDKASRPDPGTIALSTPTAVVIEGDSVQLTYDTSNFDAAPTVTFTSTAPAVASVDGRGMVYGELPGSVQIIASAGSAADTVALQVQARPTSLAFGTVPSPVVAGSGDLSFDVLVRDARADGVEGQAVTVTPLYDGAEGVTANTNADGNAHFTLSPPLLAGDYALAAEWSDGAVQLVDSATFTVSSGSAFTLSIGGADSLFLEVGEGSALSATFADAYGNPAPAMPIDWASTNEDAATVSAAGNVAAIGTGTASIVAASGVLRDSVTAVVELPPASASAIEPTAASFTALQDTVAFTLTLTTPQGDTVTGEPIAWQVLDPAVASVSSDGRVVAVANGTTQLVGSSGTLADTASITVAQEVASLVVTPAAASLSAVGETTALSAVAADANGHAVAGAAVSWTSTDEGVAVVDAAGEVTAVGNGTTNVIAASGAHADTAAITVGQVVASVSVAPAAATLEAVDATVTLAATVEDANGNGIVAAAVTWTSTSEAVATVDGAGTVAAVANGTTQIIAASGAHADTATVTVAQVVTSIVVAPSSAALSAVGETTALTATPSDANGHPVSGAAVAWSSTAEGVATVDATGVVTAVANGTASIIATSNAHADTAEITVAQAPGSVSITPGSATLEALDETIALSATVQDANGNVIAAPGLAWSTSDPLIVEVDADGLATAVGNGVAQIIATAGTIADTAEITVAQVATALDVTAPQDTLHDEGATLQLTASYTDANGHPVAGVVTTWTSSADTIASVDAAGIVTAEAINGNAWIRGSGAALGDSVRVTVRDVSLVLYTEAASDTVFNIQVLMRAGTPRAWAYFYSATDSLLGRVRGPAIAFTFPASLDGTVKRVEIKADPIEARALEASNDALVGAFPEGILDMPGLGVLALSLNPGLTGPIPSEIGNLTNLATIELFSTGFSGSLPAEIANIASLDVLDIDDTALTGPLPLDAAMNELWLLDVSNSTFSGAMPDFSLFPALISLRMNDSGLTTYSGGLDVLTEVGYADLTAEVVPIELADNELDQATVDAILADLVASYNLNPRVTTVELGGSNAAPSPAGEANAVILEGHGWTVNRN